MSKDEIAVLHSALAGSWPFLRPWLEQKKKDLLIALINANNEEARGKIKQLDEILNLPEQLQSELVGFQNQQEEELP